MSDTMELLVRAPAGAPQRTSDAWSLVTPVQSSTRLEGPWARAAAMHDMVQQYRDEIQARHGFELGI